MTHVIPKRAQGSEISAGMSTDQIAAAEFGKHTQLASLELAMMEAEPAALRRPMRTRRFLGRVLDLLQIKVDAVTPMTNMALS